MRELREILKDYYMDWRNNYLTPERFAEHNGLKTEQAVILLGVMKEVFYSPHPEE
jgi:hypothetical protein